MHSISSIQPITQQLVHAIAIVEQIVSVVGPLFPGQTKRDFFSSS